MKRLKPSMFVVGWSNYPLDDTTLWKDAMIKTLAGVSGDPYSAHQLLGITAEEQAALNTALGLPPTKNRRPYASWFYGGGSGHDYGMWDELPAFFVIDKINAVAERIGILTTSEGEADG